MLIQLGKIAGIAGIGLGVFFLLFKNLLKKIQAPGLDKGQWYKVIVIFMILVWTIALIGIGAWVFNPNNPKTDNNVKTPATGDKFQILFDQCKNALTWTPDEEASNLSSISNNKDQKARIFAEELVTLKPNDPTIVEFYARSLVMEDRKEEAIAQFEKASDLGSTHSSLVLGLYFTLWFEPDSIKGFAYLNKALAAGNIEALVAYGRVYELGRFGLPNYAKAAEYYKSASEKGSSDARYRLGQLYQFGLGVTKDIDKAKDLYRKALESNNEDALEALNELRNERI